MLNQLYPHLAWSVTSKQQYMQKSKVFDIYI